MAKPRNRGLDTAAKLEGARSMITRLKANNDVLKARDAELEVLLDSTRRQLDRTDHDLRRCREQVKRLDLELQIERARAGGRLNMITLLADLMSDMPASRELAAKEFARRREEEAATEQAENPHLA